MKVSDRRIIMARTEIQRYSRKDAANFSPNLLYYLPTNNSLRSFFRKREMTFTSGFGYRGLSSISELVTKKGILISRSDNVQYPRGSKTQNSESIVYENFDPHQGTLEFWVRPNWDGNDGVHYYIFNEMVDGAGSVNRVVLYKTSNNLQLTLVDKDGTAHGVTYDISSAWTAGSWYYVVGTWDFNTNEMALYTQGTLREDEGHNLDNDEIDAVDTVFLIGQGGWSGGGKYQRFNGTIAGRILNRPITSIEVTANYNLGNGLIDTFTVTPDTVWLGTYSDDDTDAVFQHRGQEVTVTTEDDVTVNEAVGNRSFANSDRVVIYDGTGYKKETTLDASPSGSNIPVTNTADLDKVGVYPDLDGNSQYFYRTDADFPESGLTGAQDLTIQAWIRPVSVTGQKAIVSKYDTTNSKRMYMLRTNGDELEFFVSADGNAPAGWEVSTNANIVANKWQHVAVVYDASEQSAIFYINGYAVSDDGGTLDATIFDSDPDFVVGMHSATKTNFFGGGIAHVALFDDIRTGAEILTSATTPGEDLSVAGNIIGQWHFWEAGAAAAIDNTQGDAGRDLIPNDGGDKTFGNVGRTQSAFISKNLISDSGMENGGIGGWAEVGSLTTFDKETDAKYDTQSIHFISDAGAEGISQVIAAANGNNFLMNFWYKVTVGSFKVNVTNGGGDLKTGINDAAWTEFESCLEASGNLTIQTLSEAVSDDVNIDQFTLLSNLVDNGGMEGAKQGGDPYYPAGSWTQEGSPGAGEVDVSTNADHSGILGVELINADDGEGVTQDVTVVSGKWYTFSAWAKNNNQDTEILLSDATIKTIDTTTSGNTWTKFSCTFKAGSTTLTIKLVSGAADQNGYFDDVAVIQLDQVSPSVVVPSVQANSFDTGKWNTADYSFLNDGLDTLTEIAASNRINPTNGTVAMWVNIHSPYDTGEDKYLFDIRDGADDNNRISIFYSQADNKFTAYINGAERIEASAETDNTRFFSWIHIVLTYDFTADEYELYINGISVGLDTTSLTAPTFDENDSFFVGSDVSNSNQGDVLVDDFRIYDTPMTAIEVANLYASDIE